MANSGVSKLAALAIAAQDELKALQVWNRNPLPPEKYDDMGAFGSNTMAFTQWIQFVLLPAIADIVKGERELPSGSMIAAQAVREFDGEGRYDRLTDILRKVDDIANGEDSGQEDVQESTANALPEALVVIAGVLHTMEGDLLESNLQSFDIFLPMLPVAARDQAADLLARAQAKTKIEATRHRLRRAVESVYRHEMICKPYNHEEAMRRYREDFRKGYPHADE